MLLIAEKLLHLSRPSSVLFLFPGFFLRSFSSLTFHINLDPTLYLPLSSSNIYIDFFPFLYSRGISHQGRTTTAGLTASLALLVNSVCRTSFVRCRMHPRKMTKNRATDADGRSCTYRWFCVACTSTLRVAVGNLHAHGALQYCHCYWYDYPLIGYTRPSSRSSSSTTQQLAMA